MGNFAPVRTRADLETLDSSEVLAGYVEAQRGDPEPGLNRGRAYWHGWRNRMIDMGEIQADEASAQLAQDLVTSGFFQAPEFCLAPERKKARAPNGGRA